MKLQLIAPDATDEALNEFREDGGPFFAAHCPYCWAPTAAWLGNPARTGRCMVFQRRFVVTGGEA